MAAPKLQLYMAMTPAYVILGGGWWQLVTYMFTHGGFSHILFNMIALFFFGTQVEQALGSREFLWFYFLVGVGAGFISLLIFWGSGTNVILLGASGAVYGVLLAFATLYPNAMIYVMGIIPIRAPVLVLIYTFIELASQVFGVRGGVAHLTHLAGFGIAYLYFLLRLKINPAKRFFS